MDSSDDNTSVRVALRIRPQLPKERIDMCQVCTSVTPGAPQVFLGKDKAFTFDYVYDMEANQQQIYDSCASALIEGTFEGYNATIFAYGQTGSGKTYTMGTGFGLGFTEDKIGIVPRAVEHLFNGIDARRKAAIEKGEPPPEFKVLAQFMEIYYEEILDLLDTTRDASDKKGKSHIKIHEDASGSIYTVGVTTRPVTSLQETMQCLKNGALSRTTASTNMNAESSRSHAIFTLVIKQQRVVMETMLDDDGKERDTTEMFTDFETLTAKFHFVDLAGSERLKRTGATGNRAKEGISINCGLLALGNVISALGDKAKKGCHVPYRDSKLTRLLQDSLGGNSRTVMIACVSPSDRDFMETLNTLKYANRARNIKNKVSINQDKTSKQMAALRAEILDLQQELILYKTGKRLVDADGVESINDMFHENTMLQTENNNLRMRVKALQQTVDAITAKNIALMAEHSAAMIASGEGTDENTDQVKTLIEGYMKEAEELRAKLLESEAMCRVSSRCESVLSSVRESHSQMSFVNANDSNVSDVLAMARHEVKQLRKKSSKQRHSSEGKTEKDNLSEDEKQEHEATEGEEAGEGEEEKEEESEEEENEGSEEEDLDLDMSSNSESEEDSDNLHEDLADLTCEISIKQKLIEQLELSQRKLAGLRSQYEGKLLALATRIKETEVERDRVLSNLGEFESHSQDAANRIREQYEKKLNDMQNELKKLNVAKREHAKLQRNQQQSEKQLKMMQTDLKEMKKLKVKLMNQIKDEALKVRRVEQRRSKEMAQFKKEQRQKDNQIRSLEAETKKKDVMIRRKQEEMALLRRAQQQRPMSSKVAGRIARYDRPVTVPKTPFGTKKRKREFSAKAAKSKWDSLEKCVMQIIIKRQTLSHMERDMERWLKQRANLSKKLEKFVRKKEKAISENKEEELVQELDDQISGLQDNIAYVQENISDCQSNIMQMEESKDIDQEPVTTLHSCDSLEEAKYLLEHFVTMSISKGVLAAQKEAESKELVAKLHQERMDGTFQRDMLQYLIRDKVDIDIDDSLLMEHNDSDSDSDTSSCSISPIESALESPSCMLHPLPNAAMLTSTPSTVQSGAHGSLDSVSTSTSSIPGRKDKARKKTTTTEDLLYAEPVLTGHMLKSLEITTKVNGNAVATTTPSPTTATNSFLMPLPRSVPPRPRLPTQTTQPRLENGATSRHDTTPSPATSRKPFPKSSIVAPDASPSMRRKTPAPSTTATTSSSGSLSRHSSTNDVGEAMPPCSPISTRQLRPDNVFSRLTSQANPLSPHPSRGVISQVPCKAPPGGVMPLIHTHSALGHSKAVLSVFATEDLLFSSSKDRTCKIWDLHTGEEILTLTGHPNNVVAVRYSEETSLVYTVSTYFIKVWDVREGNKCIKTLTSSGLTNDGVLAMKSTSRQVTCPPGETNITDVVVNSTGTVLYSAAGNTVRIWDLKSFKAVGKLSGGHQAAVMVLAVDDTDTADGNICVVTGSKDHYIKVFEVSEDSVGVMCPKYNLEPPHYDGIQSLCLMGDLLFSGSRDTCIKKWDLSEQQLKQSINNSHKDWICGLAFMPGGNCLLSGCRGGLLKLWNIDTCNMLGEVRAHDSPINSITTNSSLIFTASNDTDIHIWQPQWDQLPSSVMPSDEIFI